MQYLFAYIALRQENNGNISNLNKEIACITNGMAKGRISIFNRILFVFHSLTRTVLFSYLKFVALENLRAGL